MNIVMSHTPITESPESYPRRILLAVTGLSPQIVTETLYALARARTPAWIPTEVQIVTTLRGAENARLNLLSNEPGWFARLCREYQLPPIKFGASDIHVMRRRGGEALEDIRDDADNMAAADFITEHVRALTADEKSSLHVSIAGGRKTMGFFLGYALSLFGRAQDRLSHVLVSSPFESHTDFYYPSPKTRVLHTRQQTLDAKNAKVWLGDIPFVRLREGLPDALLSGASRFPDSVIAAQRALAPPSLVVELCDDGARIDAGGVTVDMAPADAAFYLILVRAAVDGRKLRWDDSGLPEAYLGEYARVAGPARYEDAKKRLADKDFLDDWFEERKAKCNAVLRKLLGNAAARTYQIHGFGERSRKRFGLSLPSEAIHILEDFPRSTASLPLGQRPEPAR